MGVGAGVGVREDVWRVTFHGVRGSTPVHGDDTRRYGGNTSCVSLDAVGERPLVLDMGTGLRYLGQQFAERGLASQFDGDCLLTHLHWDHVQGLPFFAPILQAGSRLAIRAPRQDDGRTVAEAFGSIVRPPVFPVELDVLPGELTFVDVGDDDFVLGGYAVRSRLVPHIGSTVGYRIEWRGRSVAYISDHQQPDGEFSVPDGVAALARDVDLLIHDAQFTPEEYAAKRDWGHCTIEYAVWVGEQCGARQVALFHHDPTHHDDMLDALAEQLGGSNADDRSGPRVIVAREGLTIEL
jgi:phosphoribosyl 1,2-cyclic phosphodiesterase